jgi:hypothetical protein
MAYKINSLEYQVQSVLPQVYDDSLSFYELLNKVVQKLNEIVEETNEYFDKDLKVFVEEILLKWEADGTLADVINGALFDQKADKDYVDSEIAKIGAGSVPYVGLAKFGGGSDKTFAENKTALQNAIADVNGKGGGIVIVDPGFSYGYDRQSPSTHPDFTNISNNVLVLDYSESWSSATEGTRDGMQVREFFHTGGNEKDGQHDGNGHWIHGDWHPYLSISHNDPTADNRRASIMFNNDGMATWLIGQGTTTGDTLTDDEKSNFKISGVLDGGTGLSTVMSILKTNGFWGFNVQSPTYDYHFMATRGAGTSINGNYMFDSDKGGDTNLLIGTALKMRIIRLKNDNAGDIHITNNTGASNVVTFTDAGEVIGKGGVNGGTVRPTNPTAGCMYFDLTLNKPLWYRSAGQWFDAMGTKVIG